MVMQERSSDSIATLTELVDKTMAGYEPVAQAAQAAKAFNADPWVQLINQLWETNPLSSSVPVDVGATVSVFQKVWLDSLSNPTRLWSLYSDLWQKSASIWTNSALKFWGLKPDAKPVIEPEKDDKRFSNPAWQQNPVFDSLKQSYLLTTTTWLKTVNGIEGLDEKQKRRLIFFLRQFIDAISPTNFGFTNPEVIQETINTGGQNLVKGAQNLLRDVGEGEVKLTDTEAFTVGKDIAATPGQVVYRNKLIELIQYTPTTPQVYQIPLLHIPPWVNKFYIMDLQPKNSLVKFLVDQGFTVFVVSWKNPDTSMENTSFDDYVTYGPLAAIDVVKQITGSPTINTVGYCIGGQMLATVPPYLAAKGDTETINSVSFAVTMADIEAETNDLTLFVDEPTMHAAELAMDMQGGILDSRSMSTMFRFLRANDLVWGSMINNYLLGKDSPAFDILFWNNDGTRMARNAHSFYLNNYILKNGLAKHGELIIKGVPIDLKDLKQDVFVVAAQQDHLVPWKASWRFTEMMGGNVHFVLAGSGHVAGVVAVPKKAKGYWINDKSAKSADEWLAGAEKYNDSWWLDWVEWLKPRSGEMISPPSTGSEAYPPIMPAPGSYVLEK